MGTVSSSGVFSSSLLLLLSSSSSCFCSWCRTGSGLIEFWPKKKKEEKKKYGGGHVFRARQWYPDWRQGVTDISEELCSSPKHLGSEQAAHQWD